MKWSNEWVLLCLSCLFIKGSSEGGYCDFPEFLWTPMPDGSDRKWLSKTEYIRNTASWERQREITVRKTDMVIKHMVHTSCDHVEDTERNPCFRKDIFYDVICIAQEPGDRYRVQKKGSETPVFSCMKFVKVNANIVMVYSAVPKEINEDRLCWEESLEREQWPWIAPIQQEWSLCPMIGGYDFVTYMGDEEDNQLCERVWRPSRVESECIYGEGMEYIFPDPECNPFRGGALEQRLYCWGSWQEDEYRFVIMGAAGQPPQYALRLPIAMDLHAELTVYLYFSPVCPLSTQGDPPGRVRYAELHLRRSEPGFCFDESEKCREFAREGKCTNAALHEYANFCKRSCGMCGSTQAPRPECNFPQDYRGEWMLFESDRKESVTMGTGEITFSGMGRFLCKSMHWAINRYKLLSIFTNGCRPRYTCIHFDDSNENVLQYQISRSKLIDESWHMCQFQDDPPPLLGRIRSKDMKILLPTSGIQWGSCGLSGEMRVNVSWAGQGSCEGMVTDWNPRTCNTRSKLQLHVDNCAVQQLHLPEHVCIAYTRSDDDYSLLITQTHGDRAQYHCWVIKTYPESMHKQPWKLASLMTGAQCGLEGDMFATSAQSTQLTVQAYSERTQQPCREINDRVWFDGGVINNGETPAPPAAPSTVARAVDYVYEQNKFMKDPQHPQEDQPQIEPKERISNAACYLWWSGHLVCLLSVLHISIAFPFLSPR